MTVPTPQGMSVGAASCTLVVSSGVLGVGPWGVHAWAHAAVQVDEVRCQFRPAFFVLCNGDPSAVVSPAVVDPIEPEFAACELCVASEVLDLVCAERVGPHRYEEISRTVAEVGLSRCLPPAAV